MSAQDNQAGGVAAMPQEQLSLSIPTQDTNQQQTPPQEAAIKPQATADEMPAWAKAIMEKVDLLSAKDQEKEAKAKAAQEKAEEESAAKDGTLAEVLEKRKVEAEKERMALRQERIQTALERAGIAAGIKDFEYLKLADKTKIQIDDAGSILGATDVIASLKEKHPTLFNSGIVTGEKAVASPLAGGPASSAPQHSPTLTPNQQKFYDNFGWKATGGKAQVGRTVVTFHDAILDEKFKPSNHGREG